MMNHYCHQAMMIAALLVVAMLPFACAQETPNIVSCHRERSYHASSTYQANLELLYLSLKADASTSPFLFANGSMGAAPDAVYGLALCPGDTFGENCGICLAGAFSYYKMMCTDSRNITIARDWCFITFAGFNFLELSLSGSWEPDFLIGANSQNIRQPLLSGWDPGSAQSIAGITTVTKVLLEETAKHAAYDTTRRYATGRMDVSITFPTLYSNAQCTPDLTSSGCWACLKNLSEMATKRFSGRQGVWAFRLRCNLRFETYHFYARDPMHLIASPRIVASEKQNRYIDTTLVIAVSCLLALFICTIVSILFIKGERKGMMKVKEDEEPSLLLGASKEFTVFDFLQVLEATSNFSEENKLGQGGFGSVYKGRFPDGLEIAVKRLASHSNQGFTEFKNEIELIAKLQHTNLVRLQGCCSSGDERLLIYEYMPNKSLDFFIFDEGRRCLLGWTQRLAIIEGIAQGLLYLHKHSRLRVIHRDLKPSNILLDHEMNPKISDFGLAKIFSINDNEGSTKRIVGTYGYMAPEYAFKGLFSIKSDVFSFGVLVIEIISGRRISRFHRHGDCVNLIGHAWLLWKERLWFQLVDSSLRDECHTLQMMRCINIALLCVQENAVDRPTMSEVVSMLSSENMSLLDPKHPAYFHVGEPIRQVPAVVEPSSFNDITISVQYGR